MNAPVIVQKPLRYQDDNGNDKTQPKLIAISEIFGPTIQGEGALIGASTVFVRTGGCDYRCQWCDTGYAVLPEFESQWQLMDAKSIFKEIERLSKGHPLWVTLSGGNPAMQDLAELIKLGQAKGYKFSMETQGSIAKPWFSLLDQLTLSPKPPSSGMSFKRRGLERCLDAHLTLKRRSIDSEPVNLSLKFVAADQKDLIWAKSIADTYPEIPCFVQPCNTQASLESADSLVEKDVANSLDQQGQLLWLIKEVQALNWYQVRVLPQLHAWLWGDQTGV